MNEQTNVEVVQKVYAAFGSGDDVPALLDLLTDDVEWSLPGPSVLPFSGIRHGRGGAEEFFSLLGEALEFEQIELHDFIARDDTVVVLGYERSLVKPTGRTFEQEWAHVYTFRDGKISKGRFIEDTAAQVAAFGAA